MTTPYTAPNPLTLTDIIHILRNPWGYSDDALREVRNEAASILELKYRPLNNFAQECHKENLHWWQDPSTGQQIIRNKGEMLMLMVSELSEAMEGERKHLMDSHLPHRPSPEVELADLLIRVFDYAGAYGLDLDGAVKEKRTYNAQRADHKATARLAPNGKKW